MLPAYILRLPAGSRYEAAAAKLCACSLDTRQPPVHSLPSNGSGIVSQKSRVAPACAAAVLDQAPATVQQTATRPSSAETARTIVDIVHHGTLCTVNEAGLPLGTYSSFVLDSSGQPILRLRPDAVHTRNLERNPQCSLFIQPQDLPARLLARATLIGQAVLAEPETAAAAAQQHALLHYGGAGIDSPQPSDLFYRLAVDQCFFVGGLGSGSAAEIISAEDYCTAQPDPLRAEAPVLVESFNRERPEDVLRIGAFATGTAIEQTYAAQLIWVDQLGLYLSVVTSEDATPKAARVTFQRPVQDYRDAKSVLTLLAQIAWEHERNYIPSVPTNPSS